jgi:hypothetical protein
MFKKMTLDRKTCLKCVWVFALLNCINLFKRTRAFAQGSPCYTRGRGRESVHCALLVFVGQKNKALCHGVIHITSNYKKLKNFLCQSFLLFVTASGICGCLITKELSDDCVCRENSSKLLSLCAVLL